MVVHQPVIFIVVVVAVVGVQASEFNSKDNVDQMYDDVVVRDRNTITYYRQVRMTMRDVCMC